jgi:hypothetical protein
MIQKFLLAMQEELLVQRISIDIQGRAYLIEEELFAML